MAFIHSKKSVSSVAAPWAAITSPGTDQETMYQGSNGVSMSNQGSGQVEMESELSPSSVVVATKEQIYCNLNGEAVILNLSNGMYYGLDAIGAHIWSLIQEPRAVSDIVKTLIEEYEVDCVRCERDLLTLLGKLAAENLISIEPLAKGVKR